MALGQATAAPARALVCFGSYSTPDKESVHLFQLNLKDGSLKNLSAVDGLKNPSFLKIHPNGKFLYTVNEVSTFDGKRSGGVTAFALDVQAGKLTQLNQQPSGDTGPVPSHRRCHRQVRARGPLWRRQHLGVTDQKRWLRWRGGFADQTQGIKRAFTSKGTARPLDPCRPEQQVCLCTRPWYRQGACVQLRRKKPAQSPRPSLTAPSWNLAPARATSAFHPDGKFAYVINEIKQTVTAFRYRAKRGRLKTLQTVSTVPHSVEGNSTAEVLVHPSGKFLYGSNRGHNSIAMFRINEKNGKLTALGHQSTRGSTPRNFGIDPHRAVSPCCQPANRQCGRIPHRSGYRQTQVHRQRDHAQQTGLRADDFAGLMSPSALPHGRRPNRRSRGQV